MLNHWRRRVRTESPKMADRGGRHSPVYQPLGDVDSMMSFNDGNDNKQIGVVSNLLNNSDIRRSPLPVDSDAGCEHTERVLIMSDQDQEGNGDADSGISELASEEHQVQSYSKMELDRRESLVTMIIQIVIPFFFAGFGMMAAGLLLDAVQHWSVYEDINELFILIPALLGLKGNLEMTLASRLSTAANVGELDTWSNRWKFSWGNLSLIQAQALIVASLATVFSIVLGADNKSFHQLLLGASAMGAASVASAVLGAIMIGVIITSYLLRINPDNVATPIAASLGDLVTLGLLSLMAQGLYDTGKRVTASTLPLDIGSGVAIDADSINTTTISSSSVLASSSLVLSGLLLLIPVSIFLAYKNPTTKYILFYGWFPVISAMVISSGGGWVLSKSVSRWKGIAVYSPIINGVGGNLVAVQASRISTSLHQVSQPGQIIPDPSHRYHGVHRTFFYGNIHARTARVLVGIAVPGSLIFLFVIDLLRAGHTTQSLLFYAGYLICALLQVIILLLVADWMVHYIWNRGHDPDNIVIPFLTALGDLLGTGLLSIGFLIMWYVGDRDEDVGE